MPLCLCGCHTINSERGLARCIPDPTGRGKRVKKARGFGKKKANAAPIATEVNANKNIGTDMWTSSRHVIYGNSFNQLAVQFCALPNGTTHVCTVCFNKWEVKFRDENKEGWILLQEEERRAKAEGHGAGTGNRMDVHAPGYLAG